MQLKTHAIAQPQTRRATDRMVELLRINHDMAALSHDALRALAEHTRIMQFEGNSLILARGEEMIYSGVVQDGGLRSAYHGVEGDELSVSIQGRGAFYGWSGVPAPAPSPWDMYAQGDTELACIPTSDFRRLLHLMPELYETLSTALVAKLRKAYGHITLLAMNDLETRMRRILVMLAGDRTQLPSGTFPRIKLTQEALANFVQCSRPTANKLLRDLEKAGLISLAYGEIIIPDLDALYPSDPTERFHSL